MTPGQPQARARAGAAGPPRIRPARAIAVDVRGSLALVGSLLKYLGFATLFPVALALGYGESPWPFLGALAVAVVAGLALERVGPASPIGLGRREGYFVVSMTWLFAACFGAIPYLLAGDPQLDRPVDALFEAMSGFTTTGASVLVDVDGFAENRSLAMWRQFTQWLGGMGIIVLALAVLPQLRVGGRQLMEAELPGPEMELGDRIRETARRLWLLYIALTAAQALILALLGWTGVDDRLDLYGAVAHAFTTLPTGGFSTEGRSIEVFGAATQWVIVVFMVAAGANFALTYRMFVRRQPRAFLRDAEFRVYVAALAIGSLLLAAVLYTTNLHGHEDAIRHGVFQAVSIVTTTGYASVDFAGWTTLALMTLVVLMFVGGSAGSTGGSIKVVRHVLLGKSLRRELRLTVHPDLVQPIRLNRVTIDEVTLRAVTSFILLYVAIFVVGTALIAIDSALQGPDMRPVSYMAVTATTLGNVGPAFGVAGPMGSFEPFSDVSTIVMTVLMWVGRLEVIPVLALFARSYWRA